MTQDAQFSLQQFLRSFSKSLRSKDLNDTTRRALCDECDQAADAIVKSLFFGHRRPGKGQPGWKGGK